MIGKETCYSRAMDDEMKKKIDAVLARIREPESGLSLAELGLVDRVRYSEKHGRLVVFTNPIKSPPGCCIIIAKLLQDTAGKRMAEEFQKELPNLRIEFA